MEKLAALRTRNSYMISGALLRHSAVSCEKDFEKIFPSGCTPSLATHCVAIDLDETLLNNSYICRSEWNDFAGNTTYFESICYDRLRRSLRGWLSFFKRKPKRQQYDSRTYPFLSHPEVDVQLRPGFTGGLKALKKNGAELFLVTTSARPRVEFLCSRLPVLNELFEENIGCAEEICKQVMWIDQMSDQDLRKESKLPVEMFDASVQAHRLRPRSLAMKTPLLLERLFGIPGCDLLVDDSKCTAEYFDKAGLNDWLLLVDGGQPNTGYGMEILDAIVMRLNSEPDAPQFVEYTGRYDELLQGRPLIRMEDPLYYPYLHKYDQIPVEG